MDTPNDSPPTKEKESTTTPLTKRRMKLIIAAAAILIIAAVTVIVIVLLQSNQSPYATPTSKPAPEAIAPPRGGKEVKVTNAEELQKAFEEAVPGDAITLADGVTCEQKATSNGFTQCTLPRRPSQLSITSA